MQGVFNIFPLCYALIFRLLGLEISFNEVVLDVYFLFLDMHTSFYIDEFKRIDILTMPKYLIEDTGISLGA